MELHEPICVWCEYCVRSYVGSNHRCRFGRPLIKDENYYISGYMRWSDVSTDLPECRTLNGHGQCGDFAKLPVTDTVEEAEDEP